MRGLILVYSFSMLFLVGEFAQAELENSAGYEQEVDFGDLTDECTVDAYWGQRVKGGKIGVGDSLGHELFNFYCNAKVPACPEGFHRAGLTTVYYKNGRCAKVQACCPDVLGEE